ncbi:GfdT protein [Roseivivax halodurans JCM 10272]|uniref:GfdT protein n=1 Tax=Roseivivax halodurans JCM 10272 TaxID=1449350 RepID=X7EG64_9RHOB|nr:FIST N-terminal domain-containing protein [Roseivivax halodurans]ETX14231.1 GfdT protein [Roseivivax halodurans JCM 10272]
MLQKPGGPTFATVAMSYAREPRIAVAEIAGQLDPREACCLLVFVPEGFDLAELADRMNRRFRGVSVFGCTTAGQITPQGYETDALLAIQLPRAHFRVASMLISPLQPLQISQTAAAVRKLNAQFQKTAQRNRLALTFADGLSKQEDVLVVALEEALGPLPVFGGSAGDGLHFRSTFVLHNGAFHSNAALLLLLETDLEVAGIGFDHFLPTEKRMVVTDAVPEERMVLELNGAPAAQEYARLVGTSVAELNPRVFAENPVLVRNSSLYHVRAIQGAREDGALTFLSAIDDGLLLTLGRGREVLRTLDEGLAVESRSGHAPDFILGFDCILRKIEIEQKQLTAAASDILRARKVLGFNTYGEQHCGVHVNQTFVGVAFFDPPPAGGLQ